MYLFYSFVQHFLFTEQFFQLIFMCNSRKLTGLRNKKHISVISKNDFVKILKTIYLFEIDSCLAIKNERIIFCETLVLTSFTSAGGICNRKSWIFKALLSRRYKLQLLTITVQNTEAVTRMCSVKKLLLKISQNSPEKFCAAVAFLRKMQLEAQLFY